MESNFGYNDEVAELLFRIGLDDEAVVFGEEEDLDRLFLFGFEQGEQVEEVLLGGKRVVVEVDFYALADVDAFHSLFDFFQLPSDLLDLGLIILVLHWFALKY